MPTIIPVICDSPNCGTVWFSQSIFGIGPGSTVHSTGSRAGPCPNCSGMGHIPDGTYGHTSASLFNPIECNLILHALALLREKALSGATAEQIQNEITANFPFLSALAKFLPKNAAELAAYLAILITLFLNYANNKLDEQAPSVHVEVNISQALEQVSFSLKTNQQSTQDKKQKSEEEKTEKK